MSHCDRNEYSVKCMRGWISAKNIIIALVINSFTLLNVAAVTSMHTIITRTYIRTSSSAFYYEGTSENSHSNIRTQVSELGHWT